MTIPFPRIQQDINGTNREDRNPAIQLFGRRFFFDQTVQELLVEFLLVASSAKRIGSHEIPEGVAFPELSQLCDWPDRTPMEYAPRARLNLKLFSFLGASKLDTRHESHRRHYGELVRGLRDRISSDDNAEPNDVIRTLENLFLGFQGVGGQRTWCAQAFVPVISSVVAAETIWNDTQANKVCPAPTWDDAMDRFSYFFTLGRHRFLARGGELLYLQICNALRQKPEELHRWLGTTPILLFQDEHKPDYVLSRLAQRLLLDQQGVPPAVEQLATFIDTAIDLNTHKVTDSDGDGLRDGWELDNFGNLDQGPDDDPDGDGLSNVKEMNDGTDPNDALSRMPVVGLVGAAALSVALAGLALRRRR